MSRYVYMMQGRRARASAFKILSALSSGRFCGASGQTCLVMANRCCLVPQAVEPVSSDDRRRNAWLAKFANKGMPRSGVWG